MYENQYFCKNLNIQKSPSAYHANGQIIRIFLFLNPVPVHHPDIFLAVDNHMVYHADPHCSSNSVTGAFNSSRVLMK